jgi:hypothetical protein
MGNSESFCPAWCAISAPGAQLSSARWRGWRSKTVLEDPTCTTPGQKPALGGAFFCRGEAFRYGWPPIPSRTTLRGGLRPMLIDAEHRQRHNQQRIA